MSNIIEFKRPKAGDLITLTKAQVSNLSTSLATYPLDEDIRKLTLEVAAVISEGIGSLDKCLLSSTRLGTCMFLGYKHLNLGVELSSGVYHYDRLTLEDFLEEESDLLLRAAATLLSRSFFLKYVTFVTSKVIPSHYQLHLKFKDLNFTIRIAKGN